ncbi:MAG: GNAT family N-acetyltransferase [bacterium]|nr:GNAT family N-acetyltransferase [bacterium]
MNLEIKIQKAVPEDAAGVGEVLYKTWLATYPNEEYGITVDDIEDRWKDRNKADGSRIRNAPNNELLLVAKDGDKIVGVCRSVIHPDKNNLQAIYVLPGYQGKGIGSMLWEEAYKFFDPAKDITVEVVVYNANAIAFYKKLEFKDTGKRISNDKFKMKSGAILPEMEMAIKANL